MQNQVEVAYEGIASSPDLEARVDAEVARLERFWGRLTSCRVVIEGPSQRRRKGGLHAVHVHLNMPGHSEVHVTRSPAAAQAHQELGVTIRDAFAAARRQLQDRRRRLEGQVKSHAEMPVGRIDVLVAEQDYGFIRSSDNREIYFHRNSVQGNAFDKLKVGQVVGFTEETGEKGPQATSVRVASDRRSRVTI